MIFRSLILKASGLPPVKNAVTKSSLFRPMVSRFVAGDDLDPAMKVAEGLASEGFGVSLDLLGENVANLDEAQRSLRAYEEIINRIAAGPHPSKINISIKLTALGLDLGEEIAEAHFRHLLHHAEPKGIFIRADMEASEYTDRTVAMIERVYADHKNTGTVLQSYLYQTDDDLEKLVKLGSRIRLVKGAYLEPERVAYRDKEVVDSQYVKQAQKLLLRGKYPAIATHDEKIINTLKEFIEAESIPKAGFEWQMLYGIRRDLQHDLLAEGFNVRVYLPYGDAWYPYFSRRLAERPANLIFITKSLLKK